LTIVVELMLRTMPQLPMCVKSMQVLSYLAPLPGG
jgi:hypothetical protein